MVSRASRGLTRPWIRLALVPFRASRTLLLALAGAFARPRPKPLRHEDAVAQVAEDEATEE